MRDDISRWDTSKLPRSAVGTTVDGFILLQLVMMGRVYGFVEFFSR